MENKQPLVLVKIDTTWWADEFEVEGFEIMPRAEWDATIVKLDQVHWPIEMYYGTNEYYTIDSKQDFLQAITAHAISEDEFATLKRFFTKYGSKLSFGFPIPSIDDILEDQEFELELCAPDLDL